MSLIQCPECGKEISSNAGQCVYCGYKFRVCPECGKIFAGDAKRCNQCGYIFSAADEDSKKAQRYDVKSAHENFIDDWREETPARKKFFNKKFVLISRLFFGVLFIISIIACYFTLDSWINENDSILKLSLLKEVQSRWHTFAIIGIISFILSQTLDYIIYGIRNLLCSEWLRSCKFDPVERLYELKKNHNDSLTGEDQTNFDNAVMIAHFCVDQNKKFLYIVFIIFAILIDVIAATIMGISILNSWDGIFDEFLYGSKSEFNYLLFFIGAAIWLVETIVWAICISYLNKKAKSWFEQQLSQRGLENR